jgi:hypothetical protein
MRRFVRIVSDVFLLVTIGALASSPGRAAITVTFSAKTLHVSGITPHGDVAIAGILREAGNYRSIKVGGGEEYTRCLKRSLRDDQTGSAMNR